jgi:hypothetical protein
VVVRWTTFGHPYHLYSNSPATLTVWGGFFAADLEGFGVARSSSQRWSRCCPVYSDGGYGVLCVSRFLVVCFGFGGIELFRCSGDGLVSYHVLFRQGMRWWSLQRRWWGDVVVKMGGVLVPCWGDGGGGWRWWGGVVVVRCCYDGVWIWRRRCVVDVVYEWFFDDTGSEVSQWCLFGVVLRSSLVV